MYLLSYACLYFTTDYFFAVSLALCLVWVVYNFHGYYLYDEPGEENRCVVKFYSFLLIITFFHVQTRLPRRTYN